MNKKDWPYYNEEIYKSKKWWCRHDYKNHNIIHQLFEDNKDLFQLCFEMPNFCDSIKQDKLLFTHAGFTNDFFDNMSKTFDTTSISEICNKLFEPENHSALVFWVGYLRGGINHTGSIIWADVREHGETKNKYLNPYYQIFGHTYCRKEIITDDFAMLDTGNSCWNLTENELCKLTDLIL